MRFVVKMCFEVFSVASDYCVVISTLDFGGTLLKLLGESPLLLPGNTDIIGLLTIKIIIVYFSCVYLSGINGKPTLKSHKSL